jgi:hypothetical protein
VRDARVHRALLGQSERQIEARAIREREKRLREEVRPSNRPLFRAHPFLGIGIVRRPSPAGSRAAEAPALRTWKIMALKANSHKTETHTQEKASVKASWSASRQYISSCFHDRLVHWHSPPYLLNRGP